MEDCQQEDLSLLFVSVGILLVTQIVWTQSKFEEKEWVMASFGYVLIFRKKFPLSSSR